MITVHTAVLIVLGFFVYERRKFIVFASKAKVNQSRIDEIKEEVERLNQTLKEMLKLEDRIDMIQSNNMKSIFRIIESLKKKSDMEINIGKVINLEYVIDYLENKNKLYTCTIVYKEFVLIKTNRFNDFRNLMIDRNLMVKRHNELVIKQDLTQETGLLRLLPINYEE